MNESTKMQMGLIWQTTKKKPRQEICATLKWFCFLLNLCIFVIGVTFLTLGIYLCIKDFRTISEIIDIILNPAISISIVGFIVCFISLCGLFGALRDNAYLLKTFAFCVFSAYILLVIATIIIFVLFFSDNNKGISANSIFVFFIKKYYANRNIADLVDYIQEQFQCCGINSSSQGFRDWELNEQFRCNKSSLHPEQCGVPFSCCRKLVNNEAVSASATNSLLPAIHSLKCWQNVLSKQDVDIENDIYTHGCIQPMRIFFEKHAAYIGAIVAAIILPVCFSVCLSQCLARQIDYQKYLLKREARREERRKRRERRCLEQKYVLNKPLPNNDLYIIKKSPPPNFPPPPTPLESANAINLAAAIVASKQQYQKEKLLNYHNIQQSANSFVSSNQNNVLNNNKHNNQACEKHDKKKIDEFLQKFTNNVHNVNNKKENTQEVYKNVVFPLASPTCNSQLYFLKQSDFS